MCYFLRLWRCVLEKIEQKTQLKSYANIVKKNIEETEDIKINRVSFYDLAVILGACFTQVISDIPDNLSKSSTEKEIIVYK